MLAQVSFGVSRSDGHPADWFDPAFLPSSFAMYTTMLACSYSFHPASSTPTGVAWAYKVTSCVALGAILGWPFSAVLGVPFVLEQLFLTGGEVAFGPERAILRSKRWDTMLKAVALGASIAVNPNSGGGSTS